MTFRFSQDPAMKITVFTPEQLRPAIAEGAKGYANESQWINAFLRNAAELVKQVPAAYHSFGPFWWPLKAMMQRSGYLGGEPVDPDLVEPVTMGSAALDVAAAWAFQEWQNQNQASETEATFPVMDEAGDTVDFVVVDEEFEA
jgi:hypothetical protein